MAEFYLAPGGSDSDPGSQTLPWGTLAKAATVLQAGDTLWVREGIYADQHFHAARGGTQSAPIAIKRFGSEVPRFRGNPVHGVVFDFNASGHGHYTVEGLVFEDLAADAIASPFSASTLQFKGCTFQRMRNPVQLSGGGFHLFEDCLFDQCGNIVDPGVHANWNGAYIRGSRRVVFRRCRFSRVEHYGLEFLGQSITGPFPHESIIEDCAFTTTLGGGLSLIQGTHRCLVQRNTFRLIGTQKDAEVFALRLGGSDNIVRHNLFLYSGVRDETELAFNPNRDQDLVRLEGTVVGGIAQRASNNRIYHNVFYKAGRAPLTLVHGLECEPDTDSQGRVAGARDNRVVNNIVYFCAVRQGTEVRGTGKAGNWYVWTSTIGADGTNEWANYFGGNRFFNNIIRHASASGEHPGENPVIGHEGAVLQSTPPRAWSLAEVQSQFPFDYANNLDAFPDFVDLALENFRLNATSPAVDRGAFLARTTANAASAQTFLPVDDPYPFTDGWGLVPGDRIRLGNGQTTRITSVDLLNKRLFVDVGVTFGSGETVHLDYAGNAPDIGRFERGLDEVELPPPPPPPSINEPLLAGATNVAGVGEPGAVVEVFVNDVVASTGNQVDATGDWFALVLAALVTGDTVFARQTLSGVTSGNSATVTVQGEAPDPEPEPEAALGLVTPLVPLALLAGGDSEPSPDPTPDPTTLVVTPPFVLLPIGAGTGPQLPWDVLLLDIYSGRGIGRGILRGVGR